MWLVSLIHVSHGEEVEPPDSAVSPWRASSSFNLLAQRPPTRLELGLGESAGVDRMQPSPCSGC